MKPDIKDAFAWSGVALLATGFGFLLWPLAPITVGAFCLWLGVWRRKA